jgi:protein ImuB
VSTRSQLRSRLEMLPLSLLALPQDALAALHSAGLRRIGQVLALPAAAIARRFGPETNLYLRRLCGTASDPRPAWRMPATYGARFEFGSEVHDTTALLFPLRRLLLEFQGYLRGRDCAVLCFTLEFEHYRHPASIVTIGMSAPARDAAQFLLLARERLQALVLPAPVSALRLQALEFTAASVMQADFFGRDAQQLQQLQLLLDRLQARLGDEQVRGLQPAADHRPEYAWRFVTPQQSMASPDKQAAARPCTLLPNPRRIEAPPLLLSGPERIESGWWDGGDATRDYYVARAEDGARLWVFQDLAEGGWYLQGLWT